MKLFLIVLFLSFLMLLIPIHNMVLQSQDLQEESCLTPLNKVGTCVRIEKCKHMMDLLKSVKVNQQVIAEFSSQLQLLTKHYCGFMGEDPKVCCEEPTLDLSMIPNPPDVTNHKNLNLLDHNLCGPISELKVTEGTKTGLLEFPWMALLGFDLNDNFYGFLCGGSIINKKYILTAAHCVVDLPENVTLVKVRVGEHDLSEERDCEKDRDGIQAVFCVEKYQEFAIEKIHYHPEYSRSQFKSDIALIKLDKDIDFRPRNVKPICLPIGTARILKQKMVTVTGWGATEDGIRSPYLLQVHLLPVPIEECIELYKPAILDYKHICAGGQKNRDSCTGDSGGPLQSPAIYNHDWRFTQYGVVSFGLGKCGISGIPGVYTRISYFMEWILDTIGT